MKSQLASKIYKQCKNSLPELMFIVARSDSPTLITYEAVHHGKHWGSSVATIQNFSIEEAKSSDIHPILVDNFFGCTGTKTRGGKTTTSIRALPERTLLLKLSSGGTGASVYTTVNGDPTCKLIAVFLQMEASGTVPGLESMTFIGVSKTTKNFARETIQVTDEMRSQFDVKKLVTQYLTGATGASS